MVGDGSGAEVLGRPAGGVESGRLAELFGLLSDPARAGILYALLESGGLSVEDLTTWTGVSPSRVMEALRVLRTARVVTSRRSDDSVVYFISGDRVRRLLEVASRSAAGRRLRLKGLDTTRSA
ncbi:MAG: metalloregulator ArsR/SmtB family transcription factor [Actinomycetota bacterium]